MEFIGAQIEYALGGEHVRDQSVAATA